ncbi:MliC family protein [Xanthomarina gelatinilytica]|uniref:MliC family protein n=1 Tax=Xanthomarina gelatinilytica TaxID=1137281 RepID=UPI003AA93A67
MKIIKFHLAIAVLLVLILNSCKESPSQENASAKTTEIVEEVSDDIVKTTLTDEDGKQLEMTFNNTKGIVTLNFNGEIFTLNAERAASGIWYKNEDYELRGKGESVELTKNGETIFKNKELRKR